MDAGQINEPNNGNSPLSCDTVENFFGKFLENRELFGK
jgi:hypothetical protein